MKNEKPTSIHAKNAEKLFKLRSTKGLSQLAFSLKMCVSQSQVSRWEKGDVALSDKRLRYFEDAANGRI